MTNGETMQPVEQTRSLANVGNSVIGSQHSRSPSELQAQQSLDYTEGPIPHHIQQMLLQVQDERLSGYA